MKKEEKLAIMRLIYPNCPEDQMTAEDDPPESKTVQNASHSIRNQPSITGDDRFLNADTAGVPVLELPTWDFRKKDVQNAAQRQVETNHEGVPVLELPKPIFPRKGGKTVRNVTVQNQEGDTFNGVPVLHVPGDERR